MVPKNLILSFSPILRGWGGGILFWQPGLDQKTLIELTGLNGMLDIGNGPGDLNIPRAGLGAVEGGPAAPYPALLVENRQAFGRRAVAAVINKAVGVHNRRRAHIVIVRPERRARGGAGTAQNALGGIFKALELFGRL